MKTLNMILMAAIATLLSACNSEKEYDATGTFEATEIIVSSEANGKIFFLHAEEGSRLSQGSEVGLVDTVQLYLKKLQLQANMKSVDNQRPDIRKQIAAIQEQIATAKRERARVENLLKANAANQKQLDDWDSQLIVLQRQLDEQSSSVAIQVAQVEDQLQKCHILAPIDGTILAKYAEPGELASIGKPLFKIADIENMYLRAYITFSQLASVKLNDTVKVFADFGNEKKKEYNGTVTWIADEAEFTPKTILTNDERANQVYAVKIAVRNDGTIKIGMYGEVKF